MKKKTSKPNTILSAASDQLTGNVTVKTRKRVSKADKAAQAISHSMVDVSPHGEPPYWKTANQLRGGILFTYTAALLSTLGFFTKRPNGEYPLIAGARLSRFYGSATVLRHHSKNGNFEKSGIFYRMTAQGAAKFQGRVTGANKTQSVDETLLPLFLTAIQSSQATGNAATHLNPMFQVKRIS